MKQIALILAIAFPALQPVEEIETKRLFFQDLAVTAGERKPRRGSGGVGRDACCESVYSVVRALRAGSASGKLGLISNAFFSSARALALSFCF